MAIRSEALDRDLTKAEEKEADTDHDGEVSKKELKAWEEKQPPKADGAKSDGKAPPFNPSESDPNNDGLPG